MLPSSFEYKRANSVQEAIQLLETHGEDARLLAGGHSLLPAMKLRLSNPTVLIDISRAGMNGISDMGDSVQVGACTTHAEIETDKIIKEHIPMMSEAAKLIGDPQVRNRGTLGGSLAHADPAADWPAIMIALDATIHMLRKDGERSVQAKDFFTAIFTTALLEGEVITAVSIPKSRGKASYQKFVQPASRYAIVGCAVYLEKDGDVCSDIRLAFNGVSGHAFRDVSLEGQIKGKMLDQSTIREACQNAAADRNIMSDHFASETYRKHLATVMSERAIQAAC